MSEKIHIVLSLISHTNIGKTTLARTLLKRDIGEVRDAAHVTDVSTRFTLLETDREALDLWDTPGFGNVHDLLKRVRQEGGAWGWLMHSVVDRAFNRALYHSLQAAKNVRAEADAVLYLVNVRERPEDAGYVNLELELLDALEKPVVMILNQIETARIQTASLEQLEGEWRRCFSRFSCLKAVLSLDAFTRSWKQELRLMDAVAPLLAAEKKAALARLRAAFLQRQEAVFQDCAEMAGRTLWLAARQRLSAEREDGSAKTLFHAMIKELQAHLDRYMQLLTRRHGLESTGQARFRADVNQVAGLSSKKLEERKSGLLAGAIASAGSGLMADILSGGLTFGGGALIGFLGGYLGGASYARVLNMRKRQGAVAWSRDALAQLFKLLLAYYLLAALHGRGKGALSLDEPAAFIHEALENAVASREGRIDAMVKEAAEADGPEADPRFLEGFAAIFRECAGSVLETLRLGEGDADAEIERPHLL